MNAFAAALPMNLAAPADAAAATVETAASPAASAEILPALFPELMDLAAAPAKPATTEPTDAVAAALLALFAVPPPPPQPQLQPINAALPGPAPVATPTLPGPLPAPCSGNVPAGKIVAEPEAKMEKASPKPAAAPPTGAKPEKNEPNLPLPARGTAAALQHPPMRDMATTMEIQQPAAEAKMESPLRLSEPVDVVARATPAMELAEIRPPRRETARATVVKPILIAAETIPTSDAKPAAPVETTLAPQAVRAVSVTGLVERILDRVVSFKQIGATVVRVTVKPDAQTEMALRLTMEKGEVRVEVHLTRGDLSGLREQWPQLQQTLQQQGVQLGRLDHAPVADLPSWTMAFDDRQSPRREAEPEMEMAEATDAPTQTATAVRRRATSQKGWEGWA